MDVRSRDVERRFAAAWFEGWLGVFVVGIVASLATVALGPLPQLTVLGAATLLGSLLGTLTCAIGLARYHPPRWLKLRSHLTSLGESLHSAAEAIGEPAPVAHARLEPHVASPPRAPRGH